MDQEPVYPAYTLDELLDARRHVDRETYPERARKIDDEIARRPITPPLAENQPELSLEFSGSAREYFRIWITNLCLTLLTFGIFSAWAKVRKKRYTYSHTVSVPGPTDPHPQGPIDRSRLFYRVLHIDPFLHLNTSLRLRGRIYHRALGDRPFGGFQHPIFGFPQHDVSF
jgi:hypothetical protein